MDDTCDHGVSRSWKVKVCEEKKKKQPRNSSNVPSVRRISVRLATDRLTVPQVGKLSSGRQTMSANVSPSTDSTIAPAGLLPTRASVESLCIACIAQLLRRMLCQVHGGTVNKMSFFYSGGRSAV